MTTRTDMKKGQVLILSRDAEVYADLLGDQPGLDISAFRDPETALEQGRSANIVLGEPGMVAEIIGRLPKVRWVQSTWAGVKPLVDLGRSGYRLTGLKGVFGRPISEYVLGYMLARELRIAERRSAQERREWKPLESGTLAERRVGILGTGSIGGHIASVLSGFCAEVRGLNRSGGAVEHFDRTMTADHRDEFLAGLDYVVAVLPDTPASTNLLDAAAFSALPDHAVVINVGRSNVIDHEALVRALEESRLGGAVLDVFDEEPLPPESPLWTTPGLLITAHMAARTMPADVAPLFIENARRFLGGEPLKFEIDFDRGY